MLRLGSAHSAITETQRQRSEGIASVKRKNSYLGVAIQLLLAVSLAGAAGAQAPPTPSSAKEANTATPAGGADQHRAADVAGQAGYVIGPADVLAINVWKDTELSKTMPVRPDGNISLPLIGETRASGLTAAQLQDLIAQKLKGYVTNPEVNVVVQEVRSRTFNVMGKVTKPGSYDLTRPMTVLDAVALAGGFQDFAKITKIYVLRRGADGSQKILPFNYKRVIKGQALDENVQLQPGDTVVAP
jgi:polysaccharide export outer membrane protein